MLPMSWAEMAKVGEPPAWAIAEDRVHDAIARLSALREGDLAVLDLTACGQVAVGPLRDFLFTREPSGLFLPRCQAVEALAALGAKKVLCDFLAHPREVADSVEQTGEDAVANAVARALSRWPDEEVFVLLLAVGQRRLLAGVVETLGPYRREEAMPIFAAALAEDFCRPEAEEAFRQIGAPACSCLWHLADLRTPSPDSESESSRRRRRSALRLLAELHRGDEIPEVLRPLVADADPQVAWLASSICLPLLCSADRERVVARLVDLLKDRDWVVRAGVEDVLIQHYAICRSAIEQCLSGAREPAAASLRHVMAMGETLISQ